MAISHFAPIPVKSLLSTGLIEGCVLAMLFLTGLHCSPLSPAFMQLVNMPLSWLISHGPSPLTNALQRWWQPWYQGDVVADCQFKLLCGLYVTAASIHTHRASVFCPLTSWLQAAMNTVHRWTPMWPAYGGHLLPCAWFWSCYQWVITFSVLWCVPIKCGVCQFFDALCRQIF